jgi:hypothetical protein
VAPKCKSGDAGILDKVKRSQKELQLSEKVKVLDWKRKKRVRDVTQAVVEHLPNKYEALSSNPNTTTTTKKESHEILWVTDMNRSCALIHSNSLLQKASSIRNSFLFFFLIYFGDTRFEHSASHMRYSTWATPPASFYVEYFQDKVSKSICSGWLQNFDPPDLYLPIIGLQVWTTCALPVLVLLW